MTSHARFHHILNEINGIGDTRILRQRIILIQRITRLFVEHHVFIDRAEACSIPDLRLKLLREINALGITTTLKIEDSVVSPPMLISANQAARRISRETGLARTRKTKKESYIPGRTHVGRTMHWQDILSWQDEIQNGKNGLLHLTCILCPRDQNQALFKIDNNSGIRTSTMRTWIGTEIWHTQDGKSRPFAGLIAFIGAQKQLTSKQIVPGQLGNYLHRHSITRICTGNSIKDKNIASLQVICQAASNHLKGFDGHRVVILSPPDFRSGFGSRYDKFILGGAPCVCTGRRRKHTVRCQHAFFSRQSPLD